MSRRRLLVVYKKSQLQLYREHEPESIDYLKSREPELLERFERAHDENRAAMDKIRTGIQRLDIDGTFVYRAVHESGKAYDLVVSVGGDGTLLDVSHTVRTTPLLGVNSSPALSVGHFCATDADSFSDTLGRWVEGAIKVTELNRLQVTVNRSVISTPVLNEILYAHTVPGGVSRYVLRCGAIEEEHKSSGIWISTAAGSTAAIRSAGGHLMEVTDKRMQFVVREPYRWGGNTFQLLSGYSNEPIEILSKMRTSALYLDGHRQQIELRVGDRVTVGSHPNPLKLLGFGSHAT